MNAINPEKPGEGIVNAGLLYNNQGFFEQKIRLFFNKKTQKYYTDSDDLICKICKEVINDVIVYRAMFNPTYIEFCCISCMNEDDWQRETKCSHNITGIAIITETEKVKDLTPRLLRMPGLRCRKGTSVVDIEKMQDSEIIDNTVYAGKVNFDYQLDAKVKRRKLDFDEENNILTQKLETERVGNVLALTNQDDYFKSEEDLKVELNQHLNAEIIQEENLIENKQALHQITDARED